MESALKKDIVAYQAKQPSSPSRVVTSDRFRSSIQNISEQQRKRDLIFQLQSTLAKLNQENLPAYDYGVGLHHFFEELIFAETGIQSIKQGLKVFIDKLYAEPVVTKLIHFVFKEMQKQISSRESEIPAGESRKLLTAMHEILDWYVERSSSIANIVLDEELNYDRIFNLNVFHDQTRQGFLGMEVVSGLALYGRAGQNLWLKVFIKEKGEYILPHIDWNSWIDDTEIFTVKPQNEYVALSGIVPISPKTQKLIIDQLSVFIPYAALDLDPGKHEVEVETCLFNEKGDQLISVATDAVLSVSRSQRLGKTLVSEQALGIWSCDYISGDSIKDLEVSCLAQPNMNLVGDIIKIKFDFEIYDRLGQTVAIEARFYNSSGALIKTSGAGESGYSALRREIYIDEIIYKRYAVELAVPRMQLVLEEDERQLACEICLLSDESKVLCGILESFTLPEPRKLPAAPAPVSDQKEKSGLISRLINRLYSREKG